MPRFARLVHELGRRDYLAAAECRPSGPWHVTVSSACAASHLLWLLRQLGGFEGCQVRRYGERVLVV